MQQTQINVNDAYKIVISRNYTGLCNQLWSIISGIIVSIKHGKRLLIIDKFLANVHTKIYCSIDKILCLPMMNKFLQKYNLTLINGAYINNHNTPGLKLLQLGWGWEIIHDPANDNIKKELYQSIRFTDAIVSPALKFTNDIKESLKKSTINVVHLRIEQDWIDHVVLYSIPKVSQTLAYNDISNRYIELIQKYIQKDDITFILTGSLNNKVIDYLRSNKYMYFLFPKITHYREINAAMDMVVGKQCNNVFIGCGASSFSEILKYRITDNNVQTYFI